MEISHGIVLQQMLPTSFQHYLLGLFAVANNIPALGPFLELTTGIPRAQARHVIRVSTFASVVIMVSTFLIGTAVLRFFGIGVSAFQIAGGFLLGASGLSMLHSKGPDASGDKQVNTATVDAGQMTSTAIVPIALPLTTGAGTMSTITVYADAARTLNQRLDLLTAILVMSLLIGLMFVFAARLTQLLGHVGMTVLVKVMGLFTLAIGIQFIVTGVGTILQAIPLHVSV
jgi:multiple antibiotic resistance protein